MLEALIWGRQLELVKQLKLQITKNIYKAFQVR